MKKISIVFVLLLACSGLYAQALKGLKFRKQTVAFESAESVGVFDVNGDGNLDIVSGSFWYEGPHFLNRSLINQMERVGEYFDDFSTIPLDVNGDGKMDYITGGWVNRKLLWYENPGNKGLWNKHEIASTGTIESTRAWDVDGDGFVEIVPNTPKFPLIYYTIERDANKKPTGKFRETKVSDIHGHGLGFGDINGDGRGDFIVADGWYEAPADRQNQPWKFHQTFKFTHASVPMLVIDVNKDGMNDLIIGNAHTYGLFWYEQKKDGKTITFIKHPIDLTQSQYHTMEWVDIDNDGEMELVTGKRYRAHNGSDPGAYDPLGISYFKWNGESFTKNVVSYGAFGEGKGTGIYFSVVDLRKNGKKDIIVAGKDGLVIFYNEGN